jgi:uncharacterized protein YbaR (Trm112 family)
MIAEKFLKLLVCPETRTALTQADRALLNKLNSAIARRELKNKAGQVLEAQLDGALVRADGKIAYPIVDNIPMLLVDEGIEIDHLP